MNQLLEAINELDHARNLFKAAELAVNGLVQKEERMALAALLYEGLRELDNGIGDVEAAHEGRAAA